MSSEYSRTRRVVNKRGQGKARGGVVNRRGRRKTRVVSRVMGRIGCPGRKSDCLKSAETGVGVSARIHDSNSLGDRAGEGPGSERRHAGTVEGISVRIHLANSHGDRAEEGRRSDRRQSANSLWERDDSCMLVGAIIVSQWRSGGFNRSWKLRVSKAKMRPERQQEWAAAHSIAPMVAILLWDFCHV